MAVPAATGFFIDPSIDEMQTASFLSLSAHGFHRVAYTRWGDTRNEQVLVCVHGLTRNGRDFDFLAQALQSHYQVICPDVAGRGRSEWLRDAADYHYPTYCNDMAALLVHLHVEQVDWVGTSMGGIIGMLLAAQPGSPIRRLVLNDVGPFIPKTALERIATYVGKDPRFAKLSEAEAYLRKVHDGFGALTDGQWAHLARYSTRQCDDGSYGLVYDPRIALGFSAKPTEDVAFWEVWDRIRCPVLVVRGARSDLLLAQTVAEMRTRGPRIETVELQGVGHAPALMASDQIARVRDWLLR